MRSIFALFGVAQLIYAAVDADSITHEPADRAIPNSYIVELSTKSRTWRGFESPHAKLYDDLKRHSAKWEVIRELSGEIFVGVALKLNSRTDIVKLAKIDGVQSINPNYIHQAPQHNTHRPMMDNVGSGTSRISTHIMAGVDKLHAEGYTGEGIKIGIIDSGVDYNHPSLGGGFGPGHKIIGGYDFVGDLYSGTSGRFPPEPDNDPLDQCNGHGTHVAGVIGIDPNNQFGLVGVAYESKINAYRVYGCEGSTSDDIVMAAMLRAYEDGNDIINVSTGSVSSWTSSLVSVVADRISKKGRIFVATNGNEGGLGPWTATEPATGKNVISVGSVDNPATQPHMALVSNGYEIVYLAFKRLRIPSGLPIYATSHDPTKMNDACDPLPANTPNLSDRLVLIRRGTCAYTIQFNHAAAYGARYFLVYNNQDQPYEVVATGDYTVGMIARADGLFLLHKAIPQGYTISFPDTSSPTQSADAISISSFSSYGPTYDMYLKPSLVAPGGHILSTQPISLGSWAVESGTSAACPFVAGSVALLLQARGKNADTIKAARAIFQNTASPVKYSTNSQSFVTASQQGAGLINVYDAVKHTGSLLPSELLLNDSAYFRGKHTLRLHNGSNRDILYTLTHVPARTIITSNGIQVISTPTPVDGTATVVIKPKRITVSAGQTLPITVRFKKPIGIDPKNFPIYSGYIKASSSDSPTLQSTYIGLAATLKRANIIDKAATYHGARLPLIVDGRNVAISARGSTRFSMSDLDHPTLLYCLAQGTPLLSLELIHSEEIHPRNQPRSLEVDNSACPNCNLSKRTPVGCSASRLCSTIDIAPRVIGILFRGHYVPRHVSTTTAGEHGFTKQVLTHFADGTPIPNGRYKVLMRALKITGDARREADYEVWTSPGFVIRRN